MKQQMQARMPAAAPLGSVAVLYVLNSTASRIAVATWRWRQGGGGSGSEVAGAAARRERLRRVPSSRQRAATVGVRATLRLQPSAVQSGSGLRQPRPTLQAIQHPPCWPS